MRYTYRSLALAAFTVSFAQTAMASADHGHASDEQFGEPGMKQHVSRTIKIDMTDHAYSLADLHVETGETIRFVLSNSGEYVHEFAIATRHKQQEHQAEMAEMMDSGAMNAEDKGHGSGHDDPNSVLLNPGEKAELIWKFSKVPNLEFACNIPGHYESGMVGNILFP